MKKSDLARRASLDAKRAYAKSALFQPDHEEAHAEGFEAGYRAARADLRRELGVKPWLNYRASFNFGVVMKWLRPIR